MIDATETWLPVVGFEKSYEVSNLGRLRSLPRKFVAEIRYMSPTQSKLGYYHVQLAEAGRSKQVRIHSVVCAAFHGPKPDGFHAAHLNGDKSDNRACNLAWVTPAENAVHRVVHRAKKQDRKQNSVRVQVDRLVRIAQFFDGENLMTAEDMAWLAGVRRSVQESQPLPR